MDRTVSLNDSWLFFDGKKSPGRKGFMLHKKVLLPQGSKSCFTIKRRFICPKQVNDTVTVFFTGSFKELTVFADKVKLVPVTHAEKTVYDVTKSLKTGKTVITAVVSGGTVDDFFFSVKRDMNKI